MWLVNHTDLFRLKVKRSFHYGCPSTGANFMSQHEFKTGDWVTYLKGTRVYPAQYDLSAERKNTTMVRGIISETYAVVGMLMNSEENFKLTRDASALMKQRGVQGAVGPEVEAIYQELQMKIADQVLARYPDRPRVMLALPDNRAVFIDDVTLAEEPGKKPKPAKPLTKAQQMVPKSVWRVTETFDVLIPVENPAWRRACNHAYDLMRANPGKLGKDMHKDYLDNCGIPRQIQLPYVRLEKDAEITVIGKRSQYGYYEQGSANYEGKSHIYPFKIPKSGVTWLTQHPHTDLMLPYDLIASRLDPADIPLVKVLVLRDRETGKYFKGAESGWTYTGQSGNILMADGYAQARKYDDLGKLKASIMDWTGYHIGMPESYADDRPQWLTQNSNSKVSDLPPTFEVVYFDKLAKTELPDQFDVQDWYRRLWALRGLTISHGTVVRKLYNDLDKKGDLGEFSFILALRAPMDEHGNYPRGFTEDEVAAFEEVIERSGLKRTDMRRGKNTHSMAVAVRDPNMAFQMRFTYGGSLPIAVLNLTTLQEEVRDKT